MTRLATIDSCSSGFERAPADAAQWIEIYFPRVEDLLQQLVSTQHEQQDIAPSPLRISWTMAVTFVVSFICIPGCAAGAIFLMKFGNLEPVPVQAEQRLAKADRLPQFAPFIRTNYFGEENSPLAADTLNDADLIQPVALRGSIESAVFAIATAESPAPTRRKPRRNATPALPKVQAEAPQPAPPPPSMLEKLFGMFHAISQDAHQT